MLSEESPTGPAAVPIYNRTTRSIEVVPPTPDQLPWTLGDLKRHSKRTLIKAAEACSVHRDRILFAFAAKTFTLKAPRPIGGNRRPGFLNFDGEDTNDLLEFILDAALRPPPKKGKKGSLPAGDILRFVVARFNEVLDLHYGGHKDLLDDAVLRGMRRAGLLVNTGRTMLPPHLRASWTPWKQDENEEAYPAPSASSSSHPANTTTSSTSTKHPRISTEPHSPTRRSKSESPNSSQYSFSRGSDDRWSGDGSRNEDDPHAPRGGADGNGSPTRRRHDTERESGRSASASASASTTHRKRRSESLAREEERWQKRNRDA
ncbi:hypothetical protein HDU96_002362 [Phlyctochytrium bullatum]|nr:hypothetical protein HDU96_002362 [Phlyctochytrium bullatum]